MLRRHPADERGIALAIALFALVVIGALVSGSFFAGRLEQQSGQNTLYAAQALEAAETGLTEVVANTDPAALEARGSGLPLDLGTLATGTGVTAKRQIIRLTSRLWFIRSTGTRWDAGGNPLAIRSLGLLVRVPPASGAGPVRFSPVGERAWVQLT